MQEFKQFGFVMCKYCQNCPKTSEIHLYKNYTYQPLTSKAPFHSRGIL